MGKAAARSAVVTGAASGIGLAIASRLARAGYRVMLADVDEERLVAVRDDLLRQGCQVAAQRTDVTDEEQVKALIARAREAFSSVDILVNSAGLQRTALIEDFSLDTFEYLLRVMLIGPFLTMKYTLAEMKRQRFGRVINVASTHALVALPGRAAYDAAKHGLLGLTKVAALEGALHGVTVNALCPHRVDTPMVRRQFAKMAEESGRPFEEVWREEAASSPQQRFLSTEEVAAYALFLVSEEAAGVTGQAVVIDGGFLAQ
jgi:3-hydroxybutyrate dehydrogenase